MTNVELLVENVKRSKADIDEVYNKGYLDGKAEGGDSYYDTFWDNSQDYGNRVNYNNTFNNQYWNDNNFKPKYDLKLTSAVGMFQNCKITNLKQILEDCGVVLDTSKCTNFNVWVQNSTITHLPCISFEGIAQGGNTQQLFSSATKLVYIKKIITRADLVWNANAFQSCMSLETIEEIEGEIGTSFNVSSCSKLDDLTIDNIVNAYADMTGETAPVLTVHATVKAKIVADDEKEDTDPTKRFWLKTLTSKNVTLA